MRSAEFGLYEKWIEMSKQQYYRWRLAMRQKGYPVSFIPCIIDYKYYMGQQHTFITKVLTAKVELSDTPKIEKLTMKHLESPLFILGTGLALATLICLGQMCHRSALRKGIIQKMGRTAFRLLKKRKHDPTARQVYVRPKPFSAWENL